MAIILRSSKGSPLTHVEMDNNFSTLNTAGDNNLDLINGLDSDITAVEADLSDFSASGLVLSSDVDISGNKSTNWSTGVTYKSVALSTTTNLDSQYIHTFDVTGTATASTYNIALSSMAQGQTVVMTLPALPAGGSYNITVGGNSVLWAGGDVPSWDETGVQLVVITRTSDYYASASLGHQ